MKEQIKEIIEVFKIFSLVLVGFLVSITLIAGVFIYLGIVSGFVSIILFFALLVIVSQGAAG